MKSTKHQLFAIKTLLLTFVLITVVSTRKSEAQIPEALQTKLQTTLDDLQQQFKVKGLSAAVTYPGNGTWSAAAGVSSKDEDLTPEMLIGIGSSTKTFVSTTILLLKDDGLFDLDDTIGTWVSGYKHIAGDITIRQLLNHTSGLHSYTDHIDFWYELSLDYTKMWTEDELLTKFVNAPEFDAGTDWGYSNTNYLLAGMIIEKVTGEPWYKVVRKRILDPQGLKHTFIAPYEEVKDPYAHFWTFVSGQDFLSDIGNYGDNDLIPSQVNSMASSAGCIVSTAADNAMFYRLLMAGAIISKSTLHNDMFQFERKQSTFYGLGIFKNKYYGNDLFGHGGTWLGQITSNFSDTINGISVSVLSNQDSLQNSLTDLVARRLYQETLTYLTQNASITQNTASETPMNVFPNPVLNELHIENRSGKTAIKTVTVLDAVGKKVYQVDFSNQVSSSIKINTSTWVLGPYLLQILDEENNATFSKVVKN